MALVIPYTFAAHTRAIGPRVDVCFDAVKAKFQQGPGGINRSDVASDAQLPGTVLSATAGERVPSDRIEDRNVTQSKIALLAVGTPELGALSVTQPKLAAACLTWDKVIKNTAEVQLTVLLGAGSVAAGGSLANEIPLATFNNSLSQLLDVTLVRKSGVSTFTPGAFQIQTFVDDADNKLKVVATNVRSVASTLEAEYWLRLNWITRV